MIVADYAGHFPETAEGLENLAGIGPYTAAAISSIAFNNPDIAVDGNVERVVARFFAITKPMPKSKPLLKQAAIKIGQNNQNPSNFTQAFMELGATICTPKSPKCDICPWLSDCQGRAQGIETTLPHKSPKKKRPLREGFVYVITNKDKEILVRKRADKGLLGGMYEFPSMGWSDPQGGDEFLSGLDAHADKRFKNAVKHVFTHFELNLTICVLKELEASNAFKAVDISEVEGLALPSLMVKVWKIAKYEL